MTLIKGSNVSQGIKAIRGISFQTMDTGTLSATTPLPGRIGDVLVSTTTGGLYTANAIAGASSDWTLWAGLTTASSFTVAGALSVGTTLTQTGVATFTAVPVSSGVATASPTLFKVFTAGGIDILVGATPWCGGTSGTGTPSALLYKPVHIGDMIISTTAANPGKIYIANAVATTTDWKLVTSA